MNSQYFVYKMRYCDPDTKELIESTPSREEAECIVSESIINLGYDHSTYYVIEEGVV